MTLPALNPAEFIAFCLIFIRVSVILFLAPIFGSNIVPVQVKIPLALAMTFALVNVVQVDPAVFPADLFSFAVLLLGEVMVGLSLALVIRMSLEAVQLAGQFIGYQMGFAIVNVVDPQSGAQSSVLSQFAYILALLIFLSINGHYIVLKGLIESFELAPPGRAGLAPGVYREVTGAVADMFSIAIKIGGPALVVLFCTKVSMGIVAKTVPQMNVLFVGMPLYIVIGLVTFGLSLTFLAPLLGQAAVGIDRSVLTMLRAM